MNRNTESHFSQAPQVDISRSVFDRSCQHKTTGNFGKLIPFYVDEVLPGDTFSVDTAFVCRMSTPIYPVMDNASLDMYYFFVPCRLVWEHWKEFNGENNTDYWTQTEEYTIPQLTAPSGGWQKGTIADYMGIPVGVEDLSVNALPFRAYALIYNEWFRDQNTQEPVVISIDDASSAGSNGDPSTDPTLAELGALPLTACKFHDYFTSCLPEPQKGDPVTLSVMKDVEVVPSSDFNGAGFVVAKGGDGWDGKGSRIGFSNIAPFLSLVGVAKSDWSNSSTVSMQNITASFDHSRNTSNVLDFVAKTSELAATTVNELRQAFAIQRLLERDARGGTRYTEVIRAHFGVTSPDARLQRPEYLGGKRVPIQINQVLQTFGSENDNPLGQTGAFSLTSDADSSFTYSATEHGYIIGLVVARAEHSYQQGIERMFNRKRRFDFYYPALANIGEQAVLNKEIFAQGTSEDDEAFGYQEAWAEYRYKPSRVSGAFRSNYAQTLDSWHYADDYDRLPTLSSGWIVEPITNVDRTLRVPSSTEDQLIFDFYLKLHCARPMPVYSIPGLIDHN